MFDDGIIAILLLSHLLLVYWMPHRDIRMLYGINVILMTFQYDYHSFQCINISNMRNMRVYIRICVGKVRWESITLRHIWLDILLGVLDVMCAVGCIEASPSVDIRYKMRTYASWFMNNRWMSYINIYVLHTMYIYVYVLHGKSISPSPILVLCIHLNIRVSSNAAFGLPGNATKDNSGGCHLMLQMLTTRMMVW